jgi:hypothetical protein
MGCSSKRMKNVSKKKERNERGEEEEEVRANL